MVTNVEGRLTLQHESGQLLLSFGQAVGRHQQRGDPAWVGRFDDDGNPLTVGRPQAVRRGKRPSGPTGSAGRADFS